MKMDLLLSLGLLLLLLLKAEQHFREGETRKHLCDRADATGGRNAVRHFEATGPHELDRT